MADTNSSSEGAVPRGTHAPTGHYDEKRATDEKPRNLPPTKPGLEDDDDEEEDMDALIEELESQDANIDPEEEETQPGGARPVPDELLQTSTVTGLSNDEVLSRRKKFGLNQMKEEKENLILKFLMYFVGPIQFVMEVCAIRSTAHAVLRCDADWPYNRPPPFSLLVSRTGSISASSAPCFC